MRVSIECATVSLGAAATYECAIAEPLFRLSRASPQNERIVAKRLSRSLRSTAMETRWPSMVSAMSEMCHRSHPLIMAV